MTVQEFSNHFDILYNAIATQSAPGIDSYEKSVYLTKAQLEIIKNYYDPASNRKQKGFEGSEKRRADLKELIKSYSTTTVINNSTKIHSSAKFYPVPEDTFLIVNEQVKITSSDCFNGTTINTKPVTYDEFNIQIKNPFKTPDSTVAWRLDISRLNNVKVVEIVSPYNVLGSLEYKIRYLKYPKPIILENLNTAFPGEGLTIDGKFLPQTCELDSHIHDEILDRAVELCLRDYKPQNLESKIQLGSRNE
jgi:hypothetical protein